MDKYTVDLDKVLNDFEYSELTEQSNGYSTNASTNSQPIFTNYTMDRKNLNQETLPYEAQTYPKVPTATKHSINNVFHSLNEYLNSDIKNLERPEPSEISEIETLPTFVPKPQTSIQDIFKNVASTSEKENSVNINSALVEPLSSKSYTKPTLLTSNSSDNSSVTNITSLTSNNVASQKTFEAPETENFELSKKTSNIDKELSINVVATDIPSTISDVKSSGTFIENNLIDTGIVNDQKVGESGNPKADTNLIALTPSNIVNNIFDLESKPIDNILDFEPRFESRTLTSEFVCTNLKNDITDSLLDFDKNEINARKIEEILPDQLYNEPKFHIEPVKNTESILRDQEPKSDLEVVIEPDLLDLKRDLLDSKNVETVKVTENISDASEITQITDEPPKNDIKVTFNNDLDISDSEMENELAKLEEEYREKFEKENEDVEGNLETDDVDIIKESVQIEAEVVKVETAIEEVEQDDVVNEKKEESSVNTSLKDVEVEDVNINVSVQDVNNVNIKIDTTEENKAEEKETTDDTKKEEPNTPASEKRESFALLRPNSLDLNPETTPENSSVNLIGNPGSTPYNNVYLETSIDENSPSANPNESENEANQSLSPTASEVSTSEASDSPNTSDSCNDTSLDDNLNGSTSKNSKDEKETERENKDNAGNVAGGSSSQSGGSGDERGAVPGPWLGKTAPFWTPDSDTLSCLHCNVKFTVIKRRHHCRACGLVLCSKCCNMKYKLEYMDNAEARVCTKCFEILTKEQATTTATATTSSGSEGSAESQGASPVSSQTRPLNPGNPMDYCSVVPPLQQVGNLPAAPPSVMVPVGVLKRKGSGKARGGKSVMFCDGIRPGCDLTELDYDFNYKASQAIIRSNQQHAGKIHRNLPKIDTKTNSYIPSEENSLPPTVNVVKSEVSYTECANNQSVVEMLKNETLTFAIQRNLHVQLRIINMKCCINKFAWCFSTDGMIAVGQDEIVILLEFVDNEKTVPKDSFLHLNNIYSEAVKGTSITEMGLSIHNSSNFLDSKNHAGFLYIKPTFQCIKNLILPKEPYLIGILIHRWETPWAKIFPLRLLLRLGAEYRYYPSPIISTRHRESVYVEIGHTIINLLADFRNFSYTLPNVRGLTIHMKEKNITVSIPINRYDQVMKALNNSSDHILAFAANFSPKADSHLVCMQDTRGNNENAYTTHAINVHNKPRKEFRNIEAVEENGFDLTGTSFIVLNGSLKSSSGLTAKSSIVEDGLMIHILPEQMVKLRNALRNMKDFKINCGCVNAQSDEFVNIVWTENDVNFNVGVTSPIDNMALSGVPSIRVHNGRDYICNSGNKMIRWTEVFIIQSGDENLRTQDPVDISKLSESISKATCQALVKYLDLLATNSFLKIGIRSTLHVENVSYLAGANGVKLPPIYMKSLDNELIPILHKITSNNLGENAIVIELIFHILNM